MANTQSELTHDTHKHPNYLAVFIVLAVITAIITLVELFAPNPVIPRAVLNVFYITMSVTKAVLVAMFYMHLKFDSRVYTALFGVPVLFAVFLLFMLLI
jgi:cytochrome c oxidase subunit 4